MSAFERTTAPHWHHHDGPSARRRWHQRRWASQARQTSSDLHINAGNRRAGADVPDVRRSAEVPGNRHQRRQANRTVGLFSMLSVRALRVSRTDPHTATCDLTGGCPAYFAEQSDAIIFTEVTFSFVFAVMVEADAVLLELFISAFASTVPVTSTLCPT